MAVHYNEVSCRIELVYTRHVFISWASIVIYSLTNTYVLQQQRRPLSPHEPGIPPPLRRGAQHTVHAGRA